MSASIESLLREPARMEADCRCFRDLCRLGGRLGGTDNEARARARGNPALSFRGVRP